jgi:hypothetical protein
LSQRKYECLGMQGVFRGDLRSYFTFWVRFPKIA